MKHAEQPYHPVISIPSPTASLLPVAVRAYAVPHPEPQHQAYISGASDHARQPKRKRRGQRSAPQFPGNGLVLVLDCETTIDAAQRLLVGSWRVYLQGNCIDEGLFYADDLPIAEREFLESYVRSHRAATPGSTPELLRLLPRRAFLNTVFWKVAYKSRGLVVGFNLPFDLTRIASGWGIARGQPYTGGFSLPLWEYLRDGQWVENRYRPRIAMKSIDSKRTLIGFTRRLQPDLVDQIPEGERQGKSDPTYAFRGHFLDLRTLAFALTNSSHSLKSACEAFGVEAGHGKGQTDTHGQITARYLDYNRQDVAATWALYQKLCEEFARHPIALPITRAYSPASIGKAYLAAMGIPPILDRQADFPPEHLGHAMAAYYGGRSEARIRKVSMPVVYLDFLSMYPTVCTLMDIWRLLIAEEITVVDATEDVRALLTELTLDSCFDPERWRQFVGLVQIVPEGDVLPVRAHYDGGASWQIGMNPLTTSQSSTLPMWYTLPDVMASVLQTGKIPQVLRAVRFVPSRVRRGLHLASLRGTVAVDPRHDDLFKIVIEERKRLAGCTDLSPAEKKWLDRFLKVLANATSYGIYAEMNRHELAAQDRAAVDVFGIGDEPFTTRVQAPEEPGDYCFPPIAACIAGAARLMLTLLERCVVEQGGSYVMCDTDSMAVVSTCDGGLVPCPGGAHRWKRLSAVKALSWAEVEAIRQRFTALNPYDPTAVPGSVLKLEEENIDPATQEQRQPYCYAISAKRYALYTLGEHGRPILQKWSEHGLGHLLNPTEPEHDDRDWIRQVWEGILAEALGQSHTWPHWLDRPAIGQITASSPSLLRPLATLNASKCYADQIKPSNFLLSVQMAPLGTPPGIDPTRFHLIAPYEADARRWLSLPWIDVYSGNRYRITTSAVYEYAVGSPTTTAVRVKTYRDVIQQYQHHMEAKSLAPDGTRCRAATHGLLARRPVEAAWMVQVGKESNRLEEVEAGLIHDPEEIYTEYSLYAPFANPRRDPQWQMALQQLKHIPARTIMAETALSRSQVKAIRNGHALPRSANRQRLLHVIHHAQMASGTNESRSSTS